MNFRPECFEMEARTNPVGPELLDPIGIPAGLGVHIGPIVPPSPPPAPTTPPILSDADFIRDFGWDPTMLVDTIHGWG